MSKPMIRKANPRGRSNRGPDTTIEEARSELIARLPKRQRLAYNPITSVRVICQTGGFGLYCGDEGYFLVQPAPAGFVSIGMEVEDARHWAIVHNAECEFDAYHSALASILRVHGVLL